MSFFTVNKMYTLKGSSIDIKYTKIVRQEVQPNTRYGPKAVGFMTIPSANIHKSTITHTHTHTHIFLNRHFYVDCKH